MTISYRIYLLLLTSYILVCSHELYDTERDFQTIFIDDILINGRHHRIEDTAIRKYDGSLFIERVLKLTDMSPFALAGMVLEVPRGKQNEREIDTVSLRLNHSRILLPYIQAMIAAPFALGTLPLEKNGKVRHILEIGLGTGILNSFLHEVFSSMDITVIELEKQMYEIAKKYFGLIEDNRQRIIIQDGMQYLQGTLNQSTKFDVIFIDACYHRIVDEVICPVKHFTLKENLKIIKAALTKNGIVVLSILTFDDDEMRKIRNRYVDVFGSCQLITDGLNLVNRVLACGEYQKNNVRFVGKMDEIYKKFGFNSITIIE